MPEGSLSQSYGSLKSFIVSFGFHTFIMIFQKIVDAIQRFTKTEDCLIFLSVTIFKSKGNF